MNNEFLDDINETTESEELLAQLCTELVKRYSEIYSALKASDISPRVRGEVLELLKDLSKQHEQFIQSEILGI